MPLGDGNVDFNKVFDHLKIQGYDGLFILQAAPASFGEEIALLPISPNLLKYSEYS